MVSQSLDTVTRPCQVEKLGKYKFKIILTQGLNRQIRRMCEALGYEVKELRESADHEYRTWYMFKAGEIPEGYGSGTE